MKVKWRRPAAIFLCALAAGLLCRFTSGPVWLEGLFYDTALAAHAALAPAPAHEQESGVLVAKLDDASLAHPSLSARPRALFGPVWARTLTALRAAGAKVIVFDFVLAFSGETIAPGYDRDFLRALHQGRESIVLGRSQSMLPARVYSAALGFSPLALGMAEMAPDADGVFRRVPLTLDAGAGGQKILGLAGAALLRAGVAEFPESILLAPRQAVDSLASISVLDILECARDNPAGLARTVNGKIVFIGSTLMEEDRKPGPSRFFAVDDKTGEEDGGCAPEYQAAPGGFVSGVYLHAQAADMVLAGQVLTPAVPALAPLAAAIATALLAAAALYLRPMLFLPGAGLLLLSLWLGEAAAIAMGYHAAMGYPALLSAGFGGGGYIIRFRFEERRRMRLQNAFGLYLAPQLVRRMSENEELPSLDGEQREASVMFADLTGFTALSSRLPPAEIVALTNQYLSVMAQEIDATGGYIDKYMGDAAMAIWGAPLRLADHAKCAVRAGLAISRRIREMQARSVEMGQDGFGVKIGINSGPVVVGNIGAQQRLNYTAVGDTVNVAARLEPAVADYGARLLIGEQTAALLGDAILLRELDRIAVKGRDTPLAIYEPMNNDPAQQTLAKDYARALEVYRAGKFNDAAQLWETLARNGDLPSGVMAKRARDMDRNPPPPGWDGVWKRTEK